MAVTAAQEALFAEFGEGARRYGPLGDINPKSNGYGVFSFKFHNGSLSVDVGYAEDHQIRAFVEKANQIGLGFRVEGSRGNLSISSILPSDVEPKFFDAFSARTASPSPAAQAYRAERQLDGQPAATADAAKAAIESLRERNTDHLGAQTQSVRIGDAQIGEDGIVRGFLETEVTARVNSVGGGRVGLRYSAQETATVRIPFTVTVIGGSYELKVEVPREVGGKRNGLPVTPDFQPAAEAAAKRALGEMFGMGDNVVGKGKTFVTPQMLEKAHGARVASSAEASRVVLQTLENVLAAESPVGSVSEAAIPLASEAPVMDRPGASAAPAPEVLSDVAPVSEAGTHEARPAPSVAAPAQLGNAPQPGLGQGLRLGGAAPSVAHSNHRADAAGIIVEYDAQQLLVEIPTNKGNTYGLLVADPLEAQRVKAALEAAGIKTSDFEHEGKKGIRVRTEFVGGFQSIAAAANVNLSDVDVLRPPTPAAAMNEAAAPKLSPAESDLAAVKSHTAFEALLDQPLTTPAEIPEGPAADATNPERGQPPAAAHRQRPPLERRTFDTDGMPIDYAMEARLVQRRAEREPAPQMHQPQQREATQQPAPATEAPKPVVAEPTVAAPSAEAPPVTHREPSVAPEVAAKGHAATRVGKGAGVGLGAMGLAGRAGDNGTLNAAAKVGGEQLKSEKIAALADGTAIATDVADMAAKVGKVARVIGKASPIVAAGGAMLEVNAANHAQDGRRGAGAMTGFVGGMTGGAATGAVAGTAGAGPVGTVVGGIGGAVVGGYLASEAGQRSEWGDQRQINLDRVAQHRMDADTEKLQQLAKKDPQKWTPAEKASAREIGEHMRQHAERMGVLQLPETDVDGRLRQEAQKKQAMEAVEYLNGTKPASVLKTSAEKSEVAARSIDALLPKLNDPEKGWLRRLDADMDGKVSRADVLATLSKHGVAVHSLDKDGNGITEGELLSVLKAVRVKAPTRDAVLQNIAETKVSIESERIEKAIDPKTFQQMEKAGLGALIGNGDSQVTLKEVLDTFKKNGMTLADTDRNGDGKITADEMTKALQAHGMTAPATTPNASAKNNGTTAGRG